MVSAYAGTFYIGGIELIMNYILCIMISVLISTAIMIYALKIFVSKMIEVFEKNDRNTIEYVRSMNEITFDGILEILKKKGIVEKELSLKERV